MNISTAVLDHSAQTAAEPAAAAPSAPQPARAPEPLLREALGLTLRAFRADKSVTLRELASVARVSPGYLSELERGRKEVSSELLASVCHALDASVSDVLIEAAGYMTLPSIKTSDTDASSAWHTEANSSEETSLRPRSSSDK